MGLRCRVAVLLLLLLLLGVTKKAQHCVCSHFGDSAPVNIEEVPLNDSDASASPGVKTQDLGLTAGVTPKGQAYSDDSALLVDIGGNNEEVEHLNEPELSSNVFSQPSSTWKLGSTSLLFGVFLVTLAVFCIAVTEKRVADATKAVQEREEEQRVATAATMAKLTAEIGEEIRLIEAAKANLKAFGPKESENEEELRKVRKRISDAETELKAFSGGTAESMQRVEQTKKRLLAAMVKLSDLRSDIEASELLGDVTENTADIVLDHLLFERANLEARRSGVLAPLLNVPSSAEEALALKKEQLESLQEMIDIQTRKAGSVEERLKFLLAAEEWMALKAEESTLSSAMALLKSSPKDVKESTDALHHAATELGVLQRNVANIAAENAEDPRTDGELTQLVSHLHPDERELLHSKLTERYQTLQRTALVIQDAVVSDFCELREAANEWLQLHQTKERKGKLSQEAYMNEVKKAEKQVDAAERVLTVKTDRIKAGRARVEDLDSMLHNTRYRILRYERRTARLWEVAEGAIVDTAGFGCGHLEMLLSDIRNKSRALEILKEKLNHRLAKGENFKSCYKNAKADHTAREHWRKEVYPLADDHLMAYTTLTRSLSDLRLAADAALQFLNIVEQEETLQTLPFEELATAAAEGRRSPQQQKSIEHMWDRHKQYLEEMKEAYHASKIQVDRMRIRLERLSSIRAWHERVAEILMGAYTVIQREVEVQRYFEERITALAAISREDIVLQVESMFLNAVFESKRRREIYGDQKEVLQIVHEANMQALEKQFTRIRAIVRATEELEERYSANISVEDIPVPEFAGGEYRLIFDSEEDVAPSQEAEDEGEWVRDFVVVKHENVFQIGEKRREKEHRSREERYGADIKVKSDEDGGKGDDLVKEGEDERERGK